MLTSVAVRRAGTSLDAAAPKRLFALPRVAGNRPFTVTADDRFVISATNLADANPDHVNILIGWRPKM